MLDYHHTDPNTKDRPITFEAKDKAKPWGAFALKDSKANDSIFKYCIFSDGSGDKGDLYEYTAMFSVHNVKNLFDITDRSYVLGEQTVIAEGTSRELLKSSKAIEHYFGSQFS